MDSNHWVWQTAGEQYGPLSTDDLEDLVRRNRVNDIDQIRLDGSANWLSGAEVKAMFSVPADSSSSAETGAQAAARVLAGIDRMQLDRAADEVSWGANFTGLIGKGTRGLAGFIGTGCNLVADGLGRAATWVGRKVTLAVVVMLFLAVIFRNVEWSDTETEDARQNLARAFDEWQLMKNRKTTPAEWEAFRHETLEWLDPTLESLGEASVRNQAAQTYWSLPHFDKALGQQNLVSAGWTLRDMVLHGGDDKRGQETEVKRPLDQRGKPIPVLARWQTGEPPELIFSKRMRLAQDYLDGTIKTTPTLTPAAATSSTDLFTVGIVVVDIGIVGGALVYWLRRRRRRRELKVEN